MLYAIDQYLAKTSSKGMSLQWTPELGQLWSPPARAGIGPIDGSDRSVQSVAPHMTSNCQIRNAFQSGNELKNRNPVTDGIQRNPVRGGGCDAQDDAVAVLDLKKQGFAKRGVLDGYPKGASVERVTRIDDGDGRDVSLTVQAARGIKNIPRFSAALTRCQ